MDRTLIKLIGDRLRQARISRGLSQAKLGEVFGVTFQQIQKYESGHNRISADKIWIVCQALNLPISHFYDDLPFPFEDQKTDETDTISKLRKVSGQALKLSINFDKIERSDIRRSIANVVAALAVD